MQERKRKCVVCQKLTYNWQRVNGSPWHCYDGCYSTTGKDSRTLDGVPLWKGGEKIPRYNFEMGVIEK